MILTPFLDDYDVIVYAGDCIKVMQQMPAESVDAIVTDPPYGLEFMGKSWDSPRMLGQSNGNTRGNWKKRKGDEGYVSGNSAGYHRNHPNQFQAFSEAWAREAFRILKPGAHLLAFGGTRTYHRLAAGIEDAGFEIRDCLAWLYGSGFPKSLDVSKAIDKAAGVERTIKVAPKPGHENFVGRDNMKALREGTMSQSGGFNRPWMSDPEAVEASHWSYAPATDAAREWQGWGTALKPAFEPVVVARKPLIGTVAENVQAHGTGALNIDATRIKWASDADREVVASATFVHEGNRSAYGDYATDGENKRMAESVREAGRWPANVVLDDEAAAVLDEQSGTSVSQRSPRGAGKGATGIYGAYGMAQDDTRGHNDSGGASRFFYTAKASRQDRNTSGADNTHPTVKPTELMRWLIRLVTPPGGIILDPFGGSGSTGVAARAEGVRCILIEREDEYLKIIKDRLAQLSLFATPNDTTE